MISIEDPNQGKRIEIVVPVKMVRKNIQLPKKAWDALELLSNDLGLSVSACIRMMAIKHLMDNGYLPREVDWK